MVDIVDAVSHEHADVFRIELPLRRGGHAIGYDLDVVHSQDAAQLAGIEQPLRFQIARAFTLGVGDITAQCAFMTRVEYGVARGRRSRHRLVDEQVFACVRRGKCLLAMQGVRRGDAHDVDVIPRQ